MRRLTNSLLRPIVGLVGLGLVLGGGLMVFLLVAGRSQCRATARQDISTHTQCHEINGIVWLGLVVIVVGLVALIAARSVGARGRDREIHVAFQPGWYTDLVHPEMERWWDGNRWTSEMRAKQE